MTSRSRVPQFIPALALLTGLFALGGCKRVTRDAGPLVPDERTRFHTPDRLGSTALVHDYQGNVIARDAHTPYGEEWIAWRAVDTYGPEYRFNGKEHEPLSASVAIGARQYIPALGRWASPDSFFLAGPDERMQLPGERNLYRYSGNNPTNNVDPTGASWWFKAAKAAKKVAEGASAVDAVMGTVEDVQTIIDPQKPTGERVLAVISLASEFAPLSLRDVGDGIDAVNGWRKKRRQAQQAREKARTSAPNTSRKPSACFLAGTLVWAEEGPVPIESLTEGERVWSADPRYGEAVLAPIESAQERTTEEVVTLDVFSALDQGVGVIETTPEHPFWVATRGWTAAIDLEPGDQLRTSGDDELRVEGLSVASREEVVFNLAVAGPSTYFVGEHAALVHNNDPCGGRERLAEQNRAESLAAGIPESALGPSGKPKIHITRSSTKKRASDRAVQSGRRGVAPDHHANPTVGDPHFHPSGSNHREHHTYPARGFPKNKKQ